MDPAVPRRMTTTHAFNFLVAGALMITAPAIRAEHFGADQVVSMTWLLFMGALLVAGGMGVLLLDGLLRLRRITVWIGGSLEFPVSLAALPAPIYALIEEPEEVARAWRLQRQLIRAA